MESYEKTWWQLIGRLADDVAAACGTVLDPKALRVVDRSAAMYDECDEVPIVPIGTFIEYRVRCRERRPFFGRRWLSFALSRTAVTLGAEEMRSLPSYTRKVWCAVHDPRLAPVVRPVVASFASRHGLKLDFAP